MKLLVISDTHNFVSDSCIEKIIAKGPYDMFVHCGDVTTDVKVIAEKTGIDKYYSVTGNCDLGTCPQDILIENIGGKKIMITHGHLFNVKKNLDELKVFAKKEDVDAVIFGHTHMIHSSYDNGIFYFNPGSAGVPTHGVYSFAVLEIKDNNFLEEVIDW